MKAFVDKLFPKKKFELSILFASLLTISKIAFPTSNFWISGLINGMLIFLLMYFAYLYSLELIKIKKNTPLTIVINIGLLNLMLFVIDSLASAFLDHDPVSFRSDVIQTIIRTFIGLLFIGSSAYIYSSIRELLFLHQKKDPQKFFNGMSALIALTFISNSLTVFNENYNFITNSFFVVSIILISINSLRVAWIAFLSKKDKLTLLGIAVLLLAFFIINLSTLFGNGFISQLIMELSSGFHSVLQLLLLFGTIYTSVIFFTTLFHLPTAEVFDKKAEEVSSFMDLSRLLTQVFDFEELADTITNMTTKVCSSDSAWLVTILNGANQITAVKNIEKKDAAIITNLILDEFDNKIERVIAFENKLVKTQLEGKSKQYNINALAIAPLHVSENISGYLFTVRNQNFGFGEDEIKSVATFADYAAIALENAKLIEESIEKKRLESELDVARTIQYKIIPITPPQLINLKISSLFIPAFEVGGDYFDFFQISEDKLGFVIADVSGKGVPAAFIMARIEGIFESLATILESPAKVLIKANEILSRSLDKKSFVTATYGIINLKTGVLKFARAGHVPLILSLNEGAQKLIPSGIGLGLDYGNTFAENLEEKEIILNDNDIVVLYTDGITESKNQYGDEFGEQRLIEVISESRNEDVNEISKRIMEKISVFSRDNSQHDDITLVIFKWIS